MDATLPDPSGQDAKTLFSSLYSADIDFLVDFHELALVNPACRRRSFELDNRTEVLLDFDNIFSAREIREAPWRLLAKSVPPPDSWEWIKLDPDRRIAWVVFDHRLDYLTRVAAQAREHRDKYGFRVIWGGAHDGWGPPVGVTYRSTVVLTPHGRDDR
jgi:hypothetical protein